MAFLTSLATAGSDISWRKFWFEIYNILPSSSPPLTVHPCCMSLNSVMVSLFPRSSWPRPPGRVLAWSPWAGMNSWGQLTWASSALSSSPNPAEMGEWLGCHETPTLNWGKLFKRNEVKIFLNLWIGTFPENHVASPTGTNCSKLFCTLIIKVVYKYIKWY